MGVPSFYRWLVNKYPKIVSDAAAGGDNPPGFDNLYLDMNGIIHPCFHPDDNPFPPTTFDEVFGSMHDYIDHLFDIVRPRKLLFMAIDGVAPRAKMNQQRARRFRAAKDAEIAEELEERLRKQFEYEGKVVLPKEESQLSDWNVITPGTEFMHILSQNLRSYISQRMNENPAWENIKVILSDDKVPGEGEHKIMCFIKAQRALPGYDPNTRHCLYGLDADLIMLALATHEIHFSILREEVLPPNKELSNVKYQENSARESSIESAKLSSCQEDKLFCVSKRQAYQFLNVSILREYLSLDMEISGLNKFECDTERIIDDFIFICFFAGNDFLPHILSLEIHEGCIDLLMHVHKKEFQNLGGYLVNMQKVDDKKGGFIKLKRVERFILAVGAYEEKIFSKRTLIRDRKLSRILAEYRDSKDDEKNSLDEGTSSDIPGIYNSVSRIDGLKISSPAIDADTVLKNTKELKQKLKDSLRNQSDLFKDGVFGTDKVKLSTPGWRERYYKEKFSAESPGEMELIRQSVVAKYGEGLCWVLLYYFSGVPSWMWFYTYHYGPFASDFRGLSQLKVQFQIGFPFEPFDQLMGVLPPRSSHALPMAYKGLMVDENSRVIDFYPTEFEIDVDGKRFLWQGISKLPFIEEERLLMETSKLKNELKDGEKIRNLQTPHQLFLRRSSKWSEQVLPGRAGTDSMKIKGAIEIESEIEGIKGTLHLMHDDLIETDDNESSADDICMFYEIPQDLQHVPRLLEGVNIPEKTVYKEDIEETILWHERHGSSSSRNNQMFHNRQAEFVSAAQNHHPAFLSKGAGRGFSLGRGTSAAAAPLENANHFPNNHVGSFRPTYRPAGQNTTSSSYQNYGFRGHQPSLTTYNPRPGPFRMNDHGYSDSFQNPGSNHRPISNYRPQQACSSSWQSRGSGNRGSCQDWRFNTPSGDSRQVNYVDRTAPGEGWGVNRGVCQDWRPNTASASGYARGDSQQRNYVNRTAGGEGWGVKHYACNDWRLNTSSGSAPGDSRQINYVDRTTPSGSAPGDIWQNNNVDRTTPGDGWQRNYVEASGQRQPTDQSFARRNYAEVSSPRQHTNQSFVPNGGRGQGRGRGSFTPNGSCGQGRGWYTTES